MTKNEELFDKAKQAIEDYLGDTSVSKSVTLEGAGQLFADLDSACSALEDEIENEGDQPDPYPDAETGEEEHSAPSSRANEETEVHF